MAGSWWPAGYWDQGSLRDQRMRNGLYQKRAGSSFSRRSSWMSLGKTHLHNSRRIGQHCAKSSEVIYAVPGSGDRQRMQDTRLFLRRRQHR
jgi:hypothetical protein